MVNHFSWYHPRDIVCIGVGDRGAGGLQPSQLWKNLQKSAMIGQKIGLKLGKTYVNNGSSIGQPP